MGDEGIHVVMLDKAIIVSRIQGILVSHVVGCVIAEQAT